MKRIAVGLVGIACLSLLLLAYLGSGEDEASTPVAGAESPTASVRETELLSALSQREAEIEMLRGEIALLEGLLAEKREPAQSPSPAGIPEEDAKPASRPAVAGGLDAAVHFLQQALPERFGEMAAEEIVALTSLDLEGADITDADLAHLASLPGLKDLSLEGTAVTDAGLAYLRALPGLASLDLRATQISGQGLRNLPAYGLEALHLTDTLVSTDDLWQLPAMPDLRTLKLNGLDFGDAGVLELAHLSSLQHLELDRTAITDDGLGMLLAQNPTLTRIELRETSVTQEGLAALQQQYPSVEFAWGDSMALRSVIGINGFQPVQGR